MLYRIIITIALFQFITIVPTFSEEGNSENNKFSQYKVTYRYSFSYHLMPEGEQTEVTIKSNRKVKIEWQRREPVEYPADDNQESKVTKKSKKMRLSRGEETAFRNLLKKIDIDELKSKYEDTTLVPMQANYSTFSFLEIKLDYREKKIEIIDESEMPQELKEIYDYLVKYRNEVKSNK